MINSILSNFRPNLRNKNQYLKKLGPSASLRAIRMCLRPKLDNSNNALASSEALGCASCHLLCSCIIAILSNFRPNLRDKNQYFKKLRPSASLRAFRMCLRPKLYNSNNALALSEALGYTSCHLIRLCIITILFIELELGK